MADLTRRTLLGSAAVGAGAIAYGALPAWARTFASSSAVRKPDSLPFPHLPAGTETMPKIEHVVVLMMENHTFDNILGLLGYEERARRGAVDGITLRKDGKPTNFNRDSNGHKVFADFADSPCQRSGVPTQTWNASHEAYANGANSGFVKASGPVAMRFFDKQLMPFTSSLAAHFPIGQRYFSSVLAQTYPNRRFLFAGTASGLTVTNLQQSWSIPAVNGTIFDRLTAHGIDWLSYTPAPVLTNASIGIIKSEITTANLARIKSPADFKADCKAGKLPPFSFLDPDYEYSSEENPQDIQLGEEFVAGVVNALMKSPLWGKVALFLNYDEGGGYYDHVPPPKAIKPDTIAPILGPGAPPLAPGGFDRYGFRVPLFVVSPWAKADYVSNIVQDHTSVTAFIERKWNLPAMTFRDANAHPMTDYFDFSKPAFAKPPKLAGAPGLSSGLEACKAEGLNPPLPPGTVSPS
jgi:phospholipase C